MKTEINKISVKELDDSNVESIVNYWLLSSDEHLISMGVDLNKVPSRESLYRMIGSQIDLNDEEKQSLAFVAYLDDKPIGHCNVNQIKLGEEAYMHLHIWDEKNRNVGLGSQMVKKSIPLFFERLNLRRLWCEPYAQNDAPNKALLKIGFKYITSHRTIPGSINFEQEVNKYVFEKSDLNRLEH